MTTTVSFATRDCIAIGCDSLATASRRFVEPTTFINEFFDENGELKFGTDGKPLLQSTADVLDPRFLKSIPYNQIPTATKIFALDPSEKDPVGLLFAGIAQIGESTMQNLIGEFRSTHKEFLKSNYGIEEVTNKLLSFFGAKYDSQYSNLHSKLRPTLEVIVAGYDKGKVTASPGLYKFVIAGDEKVIADKKEIGESGLVYGGQYNVIQRVVHGIDVDTYIGETETVDKFLSKYHIALTEHFANLGVTVPAIPTYSELLGELEINPADIGVEQLSNDYGFFPDQMAIEFVGFLIQLMIKSQYFSDRLPTVGGEIHIALIKPDGFCWITNEVYKYDGVVIPKMKGIINDSQQPK